MRADELDPDTAAEVRRVNLERFAGDWLLNLSKGSIYLSIDADGYYWTQLDGTEAILGADFGRIDHRLPGKMILYSDSVECETSKMGSWLWMDQAGSTVRIRGSEDKSLAANLVAVEKRDRVRSLPCGKMDSKN
jgi:hypothetical protein